MINESHVIKTGIEQTAVHPPARFISDKKRISRLRAPTDADYLQIDCLSCSSRTSCITRCLDMAENKQFQSAIHHKKPTRKGKHLYWQNSSFKSIFIIRSGAIKTYKISKNGKERVLGFYMPGEIIGLDGLYKDRYENSAIALDTTTVCELHFNDLSVLFSNINDFQHQFLSVMYHQVLVEQKKHFLDSKTVDEKVAAFILDLSNRYQQRKLSGITFQLQMIRRDIANFLGIAVESLSRTLTRFQQSGWLEFSGHYLTITNFAELKSLLNGYEDELVP